MLGFLKRIDQAIARWTDPPCGLLVILACCIGQVVLAEIFYRAWVHAAICVFMGFLLHLKMDYYFRGRNGNSTR